MLLTIQPIQTAPWVTVTSPGDAKHRYVEADLTASRNGSNVNDSRLDSRCGAGANLIDAAIKLVLVSPSSTEAAASLTLTSTAAFASPSISNQESISSRSSASKCSCMDGSTLSNTASTACKLGMTAGH